MPGRRASPEALHGCLLLGAVAMPVDTRLADAERAARTATAALTLDGPLEGPEASDAPLLAEHDADAVATLMHTSGTTGTPKPVELTYGNWLASARPRPRALGRDPDERWLCALPLAHVGGLSIVLVRSAIYATTGVRAALLTPIAPSMRCATTGSPSSRSYPRCSRGCSTPASNAPPRCAAR